MNEQDIPRLLQEMTREEKLSLLAGENSWAFRGVERLGIPSIRVSDGPHGVCQRPNQADGVEEASTSFPSSVVMAATWNPELIKEMARAMASEVRAVGCHVLLAPCTNLHRVPVGGRNFESFSEDPYLAGRFATAYIQGVQEEGVGTSLKHYACNNQEHERMTVSAEVDERTLREVYLVPFEMAVKDARPWTVMASYNRINGTYACENEYLLNTILREEWGFDGVVVSDWGAVHSGAPSVKAGCNIEMPGPGRHMTRDLAKAIDAGELDMATVDKRIGEILRLICRVTAKVIEGELDTEAHHRLARRVADEGIVLLKNEGGILPLGDEIESIAVIGPNAEEARLGGGGSSLVTPAYAIGPLAGLRKRFENARIEYEIGCATRGTFDGVDMSRLKTAGGEEGVTAEYFDGPDLEGEPVTARTEKSFTVYYDKDAPVPGVSADSYSVRWSGTLTAPFAGTYSFQLVTDDRGRLHIDDELVVDNWSDYKVNVPVFGQAVLQPGEHSFRLEFAKLAEYGGLQLKWSPAKGIPSLERAVEVAKRCDVAVICAGLTAAYESEGFDVGAMKLPAEQEELIETVAAANPRTVVALNSGIPLAMPWAEKVAGVVQAFYAGMESGHVLADIVAGDVNPSGKLTTTYPARREDHSSVGNYPGADGKVEFGEKLLMGYRHFDANDIAPLFPFGHGLSYTTFEYESINVDSGENSAKVRVTVKNTGSRAGAEVVQVYVRDVESSVPRPPKELKGFAKVFLEPGRSQTVTVELDSRSFAFYDVDGGTWMAEAGDYEILVGASATDIRLQETIRCPATLPIG